MKKFKAKKSLGQNFLKSEAALRQIVAAGEIKPGETVLEIGPGKGALTEKLLEAGAQVLAVEKDDELYEFLKERFAPEITAGRLNLIHEDILEFQISNDQFPKNYKIIANIPYNITGAIFKKFLTAKIQPKRMVLLVQKEVAQRIIARDNKESILSISVKAYGQPKLIAKVPARFFSPAPKVDSAIIDINHISRDFFRKNNLLEERFWGIIRTGFAHKRKKLGRNLEGLLPPKILDKLGNKRAEDLLLTEWLSIIKS